MALLALQCTEKVVRVTVSITSMGYDHWARMRGPLEGLGCTVENETFHEGVDAVLLLEESKLEKAYGIIRDTSSGQAKVSEPVPEGL